MCACVTWFFQPWCIRLIGADLAQAGGGTEILLRRWRHASLGPCLHGYHCYHTGARQTWKVDNCRNLRHSWFDSKGHREAKRLTLETTLKGKTRKAWSDPFTAASHLVSVEAVQVWGGVLSGRDLAALRRWLWNTHPPLVKSISFNQKLQPFKNVSLLT